MKAVPSVRGGDGAAGRLVIHGTYTQTADGTLNLEIAGTDVYDYLYIDDRAALGGTLNLVRLEDFMPNPEDFFALLNFSGISGDFATINGLRISNTLAFYPFFDDYGYYLYVYAV